MERQGARIAIVTGGSRGIGRGVAEALLGEGWRVHFCGRTPEHVETARRELERRFGDAVAGVAVDARRQEEVDRFVAGVLEREGRIDCLVNNAGLGVFAPVDELTGDRWREVIETNLSGYFYFLHAVAPVMKRRGGGGGFNVPPPGGGETRGGAGPPHPPER